MHVCLTSFCSTWGYRSWQQVHCLWNKGHWNQSTIFHPIKILLLWEGVNTKVLTWCHAGPHFDSDVSYFRNCPSICWNWEEISTRKKKLPNPFVIFILLVCFLSLIMHFNIKILRYFKVEGTSGQFLYSVFYQRTQNVDAVFGMDARECWVKGDNNFPKSTVYAPVNKAQITSPE